MLALALFLATIVTGVPHVASAANADDNFGFDFRSILRPPTCVHTGVINVYSQTQGHYDPTVETAKTLLTQLAGGQKLIRIEEGSFRDDNPYMLGAENRKLHALSTMMIATAVFRNLAEQGESRKSEVDDILLETALKLATRSFVNGLMLLPEVWVHIPRPLADSNSEKLMLKLDNCINSLVRNLQSACTDSIQSSLAGVDKSILAEIGEYWIAAAEPVVKEDPELQFLKTGKLEQILGTGRTIIFVKKTLDHYCVAVEKSIPIWLSIGSGHAKDAVALLKQYLPQTSIHLIETEDFKKSFERLESFEKSPVGYELRRILNEDDIQIGETLPPKQENVRVFLTGALEGKSGLKLKIEKFLEENNFVLDSRRSFNNILTIMPSLPKSLAQGKP